MPNKKTTRTLSSFQQHDAVPNIINRRNARVRATVAWD
uniref:Uncharacterized protein n=1 Tax=Arundo donax TaxID=35708 RepID=A0A0A8Y148_ARUDO